MELSSLLRDLHLSPSSEKPLPSASLPPITELLSRMQEKLIGGSSESEKISLIGQLECLFQTADPDWLFCPASTNQDDGWAELQVLYGSLVSALIGCAALPLCEDDCSSLPAAAYQSVPSRAAPACSALTALLGTLGNGGGHTGLLMTVGPPVCVFAVTHFQVGLDSTHIRVCVSLKTSLFRRTTEGFTFNCHYRINSCRSFIWRIMTSEVSVRTRSSLS